MSTLPGEDTTVVVPVVIFFGIRRGVVSSSPWGDSNERTRDENNKNRIGRWEVDVPRHGLFCAISDCFSKWCVRVVKRWQGFYHPPSPFHHVLGVNVGKRQTRSHVNDFRKKIKAIQDV